MSNAGTLTASECSDGEQEIKATIVGIKGRRAMLQAVECGNLEFGFHRIASGYAPKEGDRVRAIIFKKPRGPDGRGGGLDARYVCGVDHVVVDDDDTLLRRAATLALDTADALGCASVAVPAISSGVSTASAST